MDPTEDNIREIALARAPRKGLDPEAVIKRALYYTERRPHPATTAPQAVEWAFHDLIRPESTFEQRLVDRSDFDPHGMEEGP